MAEGCSSTLLGAAAVEEQSEGELSSSEEEEEEVPVVNPPLLGSGSAVRRDLPGNLVSPYVCLMSCHLSLLVMNLLGCLYSLVGFMFVPQGY